VSGFAAPAQFGRYASDGGDMNTKQVLYRYRPINKWLEPILLKDELYFGSPSSMNDPFDCKYEFSFDRQEEQLENFLRNAMMIPEFRQKLLQSLPAFDEITASKVQEGNAEEIAKQFMRLGYYKHPERQLWLTQHLRKMIDEKLGICCFSEIGDSVLMFAHYADNHRGCALKFRFEFGLAKKVRYSASIPKVNAFEPDFNAFLEGTLLTKHENWKYECEWRMISYPMGPGVMKFEHDDLLDITFGCATSKTDKEYIMSLLNRRRVKIPLFEAKAGSDSYKLELVQYR
jgi:hypothetical protein